MEPTSCPRCARPRTAADALGLAWSSHHLPHDRVQWTCPDCTRAQLPDIETHLPTAALDAA